VLKLQTRKKKKKIKLEFELTVLGSNSAIPAHGRNQTSQFIQIGETTLLIDCGEGTQLQLRKFKLKFFKIDYIFISHLHGDHYYGLMGLISSLHLNNRTRLLTIFGPSGLDEIITTHLRYQQSTLNFPLRFIPTNPDQKELILEEEYFKVYTFPLQHRIPCTGFLIEEKSKFRKLKKEKLLEKKLSLEAIQQLRLGKDYKEPSSQELILVNDYAYPASIPRKYAFCSDTIYDPSLVNYIEGVDLLYHEATFTKEEEKRASETFHSTAAQAGNIAQQAKVKKLLLGHFSTRYPSLEIILKEAKEVFENSYLSEEGITISL
jgi:ribonuclease Z